MVGLVGSDFEDSFFFFWFHLKSHTTERFCVLCNPVSSTNSLKGKIAVLKLKASFEKSAHNKCVQPTAHALSICVHTRKLVFSHTNGQHMHCG